ncbi:MAG: glycosyltransferase [Candidatus Bathyarchaeum tardum]|nr:MAG: glycosyltransferase [Candidatus Bathyarchaeum tardum]
MTKPFVTIGVCVKNGMPTLSEAIDSIIHQDYPHEFMEVIFVDDGSEDETLSLINNYAPKMGIKTKIFHHDWKGLGYTRNIVVKNSEGDFIIWVDADMFLPKNYVSKLVEFIINHPMVAIVKGKQALASGKNLLGTLEVYSRAASRMVDYTSEAAKFKSLGTGGAIYRVEALHQAGGFNDRITGYGEDFDLEYKIRKFGWGLSTTNVQFSDYERGNVSPKDLWNRYMKRGYDSRIFASEQNKLVRFYTMSPPAAFLVGLFHSFKIYKKTARKTAFLLPLQYVFKMSAWCVGFTKSR